METLAQIYQETPNTAIDNELICAFRNLVQREFFNLPYQVKLERRLLSHEQLVEHWKHGVFPIDDGNSDNAILNKLDNFRFRALHDSHHWECGADFSFEGECHAFKHFVSLLDTQQEHRREIIQILFSEIVLQAAYYHHFGEFAPQKVVMVEDYVIAKVLG